MKWITKKSPEEISRTISTLRQDYGELDQKLVSKAIFLVNEYLTKSNLHQSDLCEYLQMDKGNLSKLLAHKQKTSLNKLFQILNQLRIKDANIHEFLNSIEKLLK